MAKKYNLRSRITSALRRIWFYGPTRKEAVRIAKENGNKCAMCKKAVSKLEIDHIQTVVPIKGGWDGDWTSYIDRLFVDAKTGLRGLCSPCHNAHTKVQREQRKKYKEKKC